ncbi:response regulator [Verrucomicrobium sp. BvORR106]|uniref:response regulator n=1 Tax=Verrucomicrobium sp. BvORR106 TaxID=1403819 RepID=UPI00056DCCA0|nr:response regulator [Verrucomicrobium sp. BvORR106]
MNPPDPAPLISVVDDHGEIRELVVRYLSQHGFRVAAARDAADFRQQLEKEKPDLVVLDIMMPGEDGLALCRHLRAETQIPIIFLTAMAEDADRIVGLELGADDYLVKPFNPRELLARIRAVLRRVGTLPEIRSAHQAMQVKFGDKVLDVRRHEVTGPDGVAIPLSTAEFRLLCVFLDHPGKVLNRDALLDLTSGREADVWDRSIDNQVSRLRRKIEPDSKNPTLIKTHWGDGYCFTGKAVTE